MRPEVEKLAISLYTRDSNGWAWSKAQIKTRELYRRRARLQLDSPFPDGIVALGIDREEAIRAAWMVKLALVLRARIASDVQPYRQVSR